MLKISLSHDRLIFNMGIPIPGKTVFILRQGLDTIMIVISYCHDGFSVISWILYCCACVIHVVSALCCLMAEVYSRPWWKTDDNNDNDYDTLQWHHNGFDGISNHQRLDCLLNCLFRQIKEKIKALRHWPLCEEFTGDRWIPCTKGQ